MAANILSMGKQQGVDTVASDHLPSTQTYVFIAGRSKTGMHANRQTVQDGADNRTVRQMTQAHASQVEKDDIVSGRLLSRSHCYNVMSCHIKILKLVNLERCEYSPTARIIALITITLKV